MVQTGHTTKLEKAGNLPFVTVIIPCRNEEKFIGRCLGSIVVNDYPTEKLEVLVVHGMDEDGTREILEKYSHQFPFIRVLNNPRRIAPVAMNIGIKHARGEVVVRMDAHSEYPAQFISTSVEYLERTGADVVGGPVITKAGADTLVAKSIAFATSHSFGVGNSRFRTSAKEGYVDCVPFGAYRRDVFDKVGLFDERLVRNQDNELSNRILRSGGKIYLTPKLIVNYYNQPFLGGIMKQALRTGMWNVATLIINPTAFRWRHFIPFIFVTALISLAILLLIFPWAQLPFIALVGIYSVAAVVSSLHIALKEGIKYAPVLPIIFFLYHMCYGLGTCIGLLKTVINDWELDSNNYGSERGTL